jgi:hypothetical protein
METYHGILGNVDESLWGVQKSTRSWPRSILDPNEAYDV